MAEPVTTLTLILYAIATGAIGAVAAEAIIAGARQSPKIMRWVKGKVAGSRYLALGPSKAGKSSFYKFMEEDVLQGTPNAEPNATIVVSTAGPDIIEKQGQPRMLVSSTTDIPGEFSVLAQLNQLSAKKPHALMIFLSLAQQEHFDWAQSFFPQLNARMMNDTGIRAHLKSILIVLNKKDKVPKETIQRRQQEMEVLVKGSLNTALGDNVDRVSVVTCSLCERSSANEVLLSLFRSLNERKNIWQI